MIISDLVEDGKVLLFCWSGYILVLYYIIMSTDLDITVYYMSTTVIISFSLRNDDENDYMNGEYCF